MMSGGKRWRLKEMVRIPICYTEEAIEVRAFNVTMPPHQVPERYTHTTACGTTYRYVVLSPSAGAKSLYWAVRVADSMPVTPQLADSPHWELRVCRNLGGLRYTADQLIFTMRST